MADQFSWPKHVFMTAWDVLLHILTFIAGLILLGGLLFICGYTLHYVFIAEHRSHSGSSNEPNHHDDLLRRGNNDRTNWVPRNIGR